MSGSGRFLAGTLVGQKRRRWAAVLTALAFIFSAPAAAQPVGNIAPPLSPEGALQRDMEDRFLDMERQIYNQNELNLRRLESVEERVNASDRHFDRILLIFALSMLLAFLFVGNHLRMHKRLALEQINNATGNADRLMQDIQRELARPELEHMRISQILRRLMRRLRDRSQMPLSDAQIEQVREAGNDPFLPAYLHFIARIMTAEHDGNWNIAAQMLEQLREMDGKDPDVLLHLSHVHKNIASRVGDSAVRKRHQRLSYQYYGQFSTVMQAQGLAIDAPAPTKAPDIPAAKSPPTAASLPPAAAAVKTPTGNGKAKPAAVPAAQAAAAAKTPPPKPAPVSPPKSTPPASSPKPAATPPPKPTAAPPKPAAAAPSLTSAAPSPPAQTLPASRRVAVPAAAVAAATSAPAAATAVAAAATAATPIAATPTAAAAPPAAETAASTPASLPSVPPAPDKSGKILLPASDFRGRLTALKKAVRDGSRYGWDKSVANVHVLTGIFKEKESTELPFLPVPSLSEVPVTDDEETVKMWSEIRSGDLSMSEATAVKTLGERNRLIERAITHYTRAQAHQTNETLYLNWGIALLAKALHLPPKKRAPFYNAAVDKFLAGNVVSPHHFDFHLASLYAIIGNKQECLKWLRTADESGGLDKEALLQAPDFDSVRNEPWFDEFLES